MAIAHGIIILLIICKSKSANEKDNIKKKLSLSFNFHTHNSEILIILMLYFLLLDGKHFWMRINSIMKKHCMWTPRHIIVMDKKDILTFLNFLKYYIEIYFEVYV